MNINVENLTMTFLSHEKSIDTVPVLDNITFKQDIKTMAIIGPSGGGKSTFI